jgi:hypothetical protein
MKKITLLLLSITLLTSTPSYAQKLDVDYAQFLKETQKSNNNPDGLNLIWWIPAEFWKLALQNNPEITAQQIEEFCTVMAPYSLFAVVDGQLGDKKAKGEVHYVSYDVLRKSISLIDAEDRIFKPIDNDLLDPTVQTLLSSFKPVLKGMMGKLGENMHFFVFSDLNDEEDRISDPFAKGNVHLQVNNKEFFWRTPLGSLVPQKICPKDQEKLNGAWDYCPFHGDKLMLLPKGE